MTMATLTKENIKLGLDYHHGRKYSSEQADMVLEELRVLQAAEMNTETLW